MDVKEYQGKIKVICNMFFLGETGDCQECILQHLKCGDLTSLDQKDLEKVIKILENIELKPSCCPDCGSNLKENLTNEYFSQVNYCPNCGIRIFPSIISNKRNGGE